MTETKYSKHFLMDTKSVIDFVKDNLPDFFAEDADLEASEIGDGNINYVFKVVDKKNGKSLVVKQADIYLRSSGRPFDTHHNKIEYEILATEGRLAPGYVPEIYNYNEAMCALTMEDVSEYKNLRKEMMTGKTFEKLADDITTFMADTLLPTTDLILDRHEKKKKVQLFTNIECCDITEDLVLTEPYYNYKNQNTITKGEEDFVKENLYDNEHLHAEVGYLRNNFMNNAQALLHGDLHSGSIFVNNSGIKVLDPEFAFYGPMGYDIGNVIGNMFFAWANKAVTDSDNSQFLTWVKEQIEEMYDLTYEKLSKKYDEQVKFPLYNTEFKKNYLASVMADSMGYAGTEMIRRTVGDSKVAEVTSVTDHDQRVKVDETLIKTGMIFIENRGEFSNGSDITKVFEEELIK
ncbi:MAG: S-methyl-5-thioribose kinase [Erysipelotrichaceae bacterium]|nr:S-methyl-5-thioribose kinase [Erysipelotrichaceae bacterium]MCH4044445.1 S-methyl-5-thioribose kinase [Erysipelotrichaceae bacterium]MCH4121658.1 S-methyl-5-thioribose kinase [Erysipelotrichaceae bacterium]